MIEYKLDDGNYLNEEDFVQYAKWKINELKKEKYSDEEIIYFDDDINWQNIIRYLLRNF